MVVASFSGTGMVRANSPVGSSEMSANSEGSVARNLSMVGPCKSMVLATRPTAGSIPSTACASCMNTYWPWAVKARTALHRLPLEPSVCV